MRPPLDPPNEQARLEALHAYQILDTLQESRFDDLTGLASVLTESPISLISLIDKDRQWFKSCINCDITETSRAISFCAHVVESGTILNIPNTLKDDRFFDNPLVTGPPFIRAYAGVPLKTSEAFILGTLCVIDTTARSYSQTHIQHLQILANQVMAQLELTRQLRRVEEEHLALSKNEIKLHSLINPLKESLILVDSTGVIQELNPSAKALLNDKEPIGKKFQETSVLLNHTNHNPVDLLTLAHTGETIHNEQRMIQSMKGDRWFNINLIPIKQWGTAPYSIVIQVNEVTALHQAKVESERLRQQLQRQERLTTIGTLSAGLSHEINNPLCVVMSNIEYLLEFVDETSLEPSVHQELRTILQQSKLSAEQIEQVIQALGLFARNDSSSTVANVREAVNIAIQMLHNQLNQSAHFDLVILDNYTIDGSIRDLSQLLIHLLLNAIQSFNSKDLKNNIIRLTVEPHDSELIIAVSDNGTGIPIEHRSKIYDPFYTTKQVGSATGMGLSLCHHLCELLSARLWIHSRSQDDPIYQDEYPYFKYGTTVYIALPSFKRSELD